MWPQRKQQTSHVDNTNLISDCKSTSKTQLYGATPPVGVTERHHRSAGYMSPKSPSSPTSVKDLSLYDSGRTDSGFLSGSNIVSDQCLSSDDILLSSDKLPESDPSTRESKEDSKSLMRLDSGVDVGLTDQFSGLSLDLDTASLNDLNSTSSKSQSKDSTRLSNINVYSSTDKTAKSSKPSEQLQPPVFVDPYPAWRLYFQQDEDGDTQLHIAIIHGFIEVVYSLIQMVPHPAYLDIVNSVGQTPLHLAVLTRQSHVVRRLLIAGANVVARDREGNTALHLASQYGDLQSVKALMEPVMVAETMSANLRYQAGAQQVPQDLEQRNYDGQMCVHLAALGGHVDVLRHLVWFGANINAREGKSGRTPLHYCIEYGISHVLQFLLSECDSVLQLETATYAGFTAYQLASCIDATLARSLMEKGATARKAPASDSESDSDFSDDDDEMYWKSSPNSYFASHMLNSGPIDISA